MDTMIVSVKELSGQDRQMARRKYSDTFKRKIAEEALLPGASVSQLSRRYDLNANMIFGWRDEYRHRQLGFAEGAEVPVEADPEFIAVGVITEAGQAIPILAADRPRLPPPVIKKTSTAVSRQVEVELRNGIKLRLDAGMATETLRRIVGALKSNA